MLVVENNQSGVFWSMGDTVKTMDYAGEVVIAFDPSKTNMAMVLGTPDGTVLNVLEFSGNNRKRGPVQDTTVYCNEVRAFLSTYLRNVKLYAVGVEQAIQKKGNEYYHSSMVLTEIRANILNFFLEVFNIKVIEINNWSWKHAVLPEGYRGMYMKGSKKWFLDYMPKSPYAHYFEADVTDCLCIYKYMIGKFCSGYSMYCNTYEPCNIKYDYLIMTWDTTNPPDVKEVLYNNRFSFEENVGYYVNRIVGRFMMEVNVDDIPIDKIYGKTIGYHFQHIEDEKVKVMVWRA